MAVGIKRKAGAVEEDGAVPRAPGKVARLAKAKRTTASAATAKATTKVQPKKDMATLTVTTTKSDETPTDATHTQQQQQQRQQEQAALLARIAAAPGRTPFEKRAWSLLLQIPRGRVTTYGILASALGSSPRAVGGAMRRNPFAPEVPCHRCVAAGGGLGGFKGERPKSGEGITLAEKRALLREEGVRFDAAGERVLGSPFEGFV